RARGPFVSLDPHEPVRDGNLEVWRGVLDHVDAFAPGEDELRIDEALRDPAAAIERVPGSRLRFAVFKRGGKGGLLLDRSNGEIFEWRAPASRVVDPTGAGDAFMGGFLAGWLDHAE